MTKIYFFIFSPYTAHTRSGSHTIALFHLWDSQTHPQQKRESSDLLGGWPLTCHECTPTASPRHGSQGEKTQSCSTTAPGPIHQGFSWGPLLRALCFQCSV